MRKTSMGSTPRLAPISAPAPALATTLEIFRNKIFLLNARRSATSISATPYQIISGEKPNRLCNQENEHELPHEGSVHCKIRRLLLILLSLLLSLAKYLRPNAKHCRPFFNCHFEIIAHPHAKVVQIQMLLDVIEFAESAAANFHILRKRSHCHEPCKFHIFIRKVFHCGKKALDLI